MFKRIKRLLRKRNNGGFTLVEVIVATALLGVLMLGMFGFVQPVLKSVREKEQNARAVMLAETIESYIANSTKYAYFVQTFSGVIPTDVASASASELAPIAKAKYSGEEEPYKSAAGTLEEMKTVMNSLNAENYEIRCIGMRWLTEPKSGEKKLMLTNEVVNQDNLSLNLTDPMLVPSEPTSEPTSEPSPAPTPETNRSKLVFEPCFYDGLYPVLRFGNFTNQYQVLDSTTSTVVDKYPAEEVKIAPGLEITMDIYIEPTCYSTDEATRTRLPQTFTGTTYAGYRNISSALNASGKYKLIPNAEMHSYSDALEANGAAVYKNPDIGDTYYPDTFIYYLARKTKTQGNAGGGTSVPESTPESTPTT